jgi:hypothetical protein
VVKIATFAKPETVTANAPRSADNDGVEDKDLFPQTIK